MISISTSSQHLQSPSSSITPTQRHTARAPNPAPLLDGRNQSLSPCSTACQVIPTQLLAPALPHPIDNPQFFRSTQFRIFKVLDILQKPLPESRPRWQRHQSILPKVCQGQHQQSRRQSGDTVRVCGLGMAVAMR